MDNKEKLSRLNRHESRRSNNKILLFFIVLAVIFIVILFSLIAFGNKSKSDDKIDEKENQTSQAENEADSNGNNVDSNENNPSKAEEDADGTSNTPEENDQDGRIGAPLEDYKVDTPEDLDDNVMEVYSGDWAPVGTRQTGEHATVYDNGSDDRLEIKKATSIVTGITEDDMVEWFVGNGGDHQTAIAQVSDKAETAYYKVYLSWVDEQGWQVTRVEMVKSVPK